MKLIMETEIVSNENVRPCFPTPRHLQTYKLSMLDQLVPPMLVPIVLYFPNTNLDNTYLEVLKNSLSLILSRFYPLAGRIAYDGLSVDCNDEGVPFSVVRIKGHKLSDLLKNPDQQLPQKLLPREVSMETEVGGGHSLVLIRVNEFDCGGIAIGALFAHTVADAAVMGYFLNSWAATARGSKEPVSPNYISPSLFPQKEELQSQRVSLGSIFKRGKSTMQRYVFDASSIAKLKENSGVKQPSRVEVVSALLWKCFMAASLANDKQVSLLSHAMNLRRRAQPQFSAECFGNFICAAMAPSTNKTDKDLGELVEEIRAAVRKIDSDFMNRSMGDNGLLGHYENQGRLFSGIPRVADLLCISSWCGFGLYNADFGWGKPIWLTRTDAGSELESPLLNNIWLIDTKTNGEIEAWVTLEDKYMAVFDNIDELQAFVAKNPSPLDILE